VTEARRTWITRYLNSRFTTLPDHVELLVRELRPSSDWRDPGPLRRIHGQHHHLHQHATAAGTIELSDARCHWWLLDEDHSRRRRESATWMSSGHAAALFRGELYNVLAPTRGGYQRLQDFGVRFGYERVVLYIEPPVDHMRVAPNTARSVLLLDHEPLPWLQWGREFSERMPAEILDLQERVAADDRLPRAEAIRARLRPQISLYSLSPHRQPRTSGSPEQDTSTSKPTPNQVTVPHIPHIRDDPGAIGGPRSDADPLANTAREHRTGEPDLELPDVAWVSAANGSRAPGDLEDQAARYRAERHQLTINGDFRAFRDMVKRWAREYDGVPGARAVIEPLVREWFEQALVEVILSAKRSTCSRERLQQLLSPPSLTAAVLPRYLIDQQIRKRLAQKLGHRTPTT
jgi:hypothetical protein